MTNPEQMLRILAGQATYNLQLSHVMSAKFKVQPLVGSFASKYMWGGSASGRKGISRLNLDKCVTTYN